MKRFRVDINEQGKTLLQNTSLCILCIDAKERKMKMVKKSSLLLLKGHVRTSRF